MVQSKAVCGSGMKRGAKSERSLEMVVASAFLQRADCLQQTSPSAYTMSARLQMQKFVSQVLFARLPRTRGLGIRDGGQDNR